MKFIEVAQAFQVLEQEPSRLAMTHTLASLFAKAASDEIGIIAHLSLGQLQAPYLGKQFNIAEKNLIKIIASMQKKGESDIQQALHQYGDLGLVCEQGGWEAKQSLSVTQLYKRLEELQSISGIGSHEEKANHLKSLFEDIEPIAAKYVVRIILGKLRMGFSDMTIVDALSYMIAGDKSLRGIIENAYNICVDIGFIAQELKSKGITALEHMRIQVGVPIRPEAAERMVSAQEIMDKVGPCVAQPKIDGFRVQVHVKKTDAGHYQIHFFSRNLLDMSVMFPDLAQDLQTIPVDDIIFEGEAIVYDPQTASYLPFQETVKRKRKHGVEQVMQELPLRVFVFNVFYLNGKDLLSTSEHDRRAILIDLFSTFKSDLFQVIEERVINNAKELDDYFNSCISSGLEGLMVKKPSAPYQPGKRNFNWIKLKRSTAGHIEDSIDCVILGYNFGEGKRSSFGIGALLVGVYNKKHDRFESIAKIGTGLSDDQWKELKSLLDARAVPEQPKNVIVAKELHPNVWVNPSIVCTVFADEITLSPLHAAGKIEHKAGYALRFPRYVEYRMDKGATDATEVSEIESLYKDQFKQH